MQGSPLGILNSYRNCTELQYWELHILLPACHSLPAVLPLSHTVLSLQSPGFMNSDPPVDQSEQQPEPEEELPSRARVPRQGETVQPARPPAVDVAFEGGLRQPVRYPTVDVDILHLRSEIRLLHTQIESNDTTVRLLSSIVIAQAGLIRELHSANPIPQHLFDILDQAQSQLPRPQTTDPLHSASDSPADVNPSQQQRLWGSYPNRWGPTSSERGDSSDDVI